MDAQAALEHANRWRDTAITDATDARAEAATSYHAPHLFFALY